MSEKQGFGNKYFMAKQKKIETEFKCRDCRKAYDYYGENYEGTPLLAKCKENINSVLLSSNQCSKFVRK